MTDTITGRQIQQLRREAEAHGDLEQSAICQRALGADPSDAEPGTALAECELSQAEAVEECARVIAYAQAEHHEDW